MRIFRLWTNARAEAERAACDVLVAEITQLLENASLKLKGNAKR
jgi:hypothetical protein